MTDSRFFIGENNRVQTTRPVPASIVGIITLCALSLSGCTQHERSSDAGHYPSAIEQLAVHREDPDPLVESQTRGREVYDHYCQICHGPKAQGNGFNAAMLDPPPRNFADEAFWAQADDAHLLDVVAQGGKASGKSVLMPAWGHTINENQVHDVIAFLRTVPERAKQAAADGQNEPDDE